MSNFLMCLIDGIRIVIPFYDKRNKSLPYTAVFVLIIGLIDFGLSITKFPSELLRELTLSITLILLAFLYVGKREIGTLFQCVIFISFEGALSTFLFALASQVGYEISAIPQVPFQLSVQLLKTGIALLYRRYLKSINMALPKKESIHLFLPVLSIAILDEFIFQGFFLIEEPYYNWIVFLSFALYLLVLYLSKWQLTLLNEQHKNQLVDQSVKLLKEQNTHLKEESTHMHKIKHDMVHHLNTVYSLLSDNQIEEAKTYLKETEGIILKTSNIGWTKDAYVDSVLNYKINAYPNVDFRLDVLTLSKSSIKSIDLGMILSNLIDNAAKEVMKTSVEEKYIAINMRQKRQGIFLLVSNPLASEEDRLEEINGDSAQHGYGLTIVESIVNQYNGSMVIDKDTTFDVRIMLQEKEIKC